MQTEYTLTTALNGTSAVTILPAPVSGRRIVGRVRVCNLEAGDISPILQLNENSTISQITGAGDVYHPGEQFIDGEGVVLGSSTTSLEMKLDVAGTACRAVVSYLEVT